MIASAPLLLAAKKAIKVAPEHMASNTTALWWVVALVLLFFLVRPELFHRLAVRRVDPRPAGLLRIFFGMTLVVSLLDLTQWFTILFTDEGLLLTDMARKRYGAQLRTSWDPEHGFESTWEMLKLLGTKWTVLHMRSDPPFVAAIFAGTIFSAVCLTLGWRTRLFSFLAFVGTMQIYNYSPFWLAGGDTVTRCGLFLGLFVQWGEAYSLDAWRARRKAILGGAEGVPALRSIPVWPLQLFVVQLACIYSATGMLKSGSTWSNGTAIYYALNLDHFYRMPMTSLASVGQWAGVFPVSTWVVHWWEILFPISILGLVIGEFERTRHAEGPDGSVAWSNAGTLRRVLSWVIVAAVIGLLAYVMGWAAKYHYDPKQLLKAFQVGAEKVRILTSAAVVLIAVVAVSLYLVSEKRPRFKHVLVHWVVGRRVWLTLGVGMHLGIGVLMNVGTFVPVMLALYAAFLRGEDVEAFWKFVGSRPVQPGTTTPSGDKRPVHKGWGRRLKTLADRARFREPRPPVVVLHGADEISIRRVALLRCWDLAHRLRFELEEEGSSSSLRVRQGERVLEGGQAGAHLTSLLPGLWLIWLPGLVVEQLLRPLRLAPDRLRAAMGLVALFFLRQKA